jgi:hypothetical protein
MLIIVRAGLKSSGRQSSFTPAKGSISNPYYSGQPTRPIIRDIESVSREDDPVVVHIRQATEIRLDDMKLVSAALIIPSSLDLARFFFR